MKKIFMLSCAMIVLFACGCMFKRHVNGSGTVTETERNYTAGTYELTVDISRDNKPIDIVFFVSGEPIIKLVTDDNIAAEIAIETADGKIEFTGKRATVYDATEFRIEIGGLTLQKLTLRGGYKITDTANAVFASDFTLVTEGSFRGTGDFGLVTGKLAFRFEGSATMTAENISASELKVHNEGSATVILAGTAAVFTYHGEGSVKLTADELLSQYVDLDVMGSINATVNAEKTLKVKVQGSGKVKYLGQPAITQNVQGSVTVAPLK
jgi:hypothetical protein